LAAVEIVARIERRRKWTAEEKSALLAELEAEGGKVAVVARRHRISESLLYSWRSAGKAAAAVRCTAEPMAFVPMGVIRRADDGGPALLAPPSPVQPANIRASIENRAGMIEIVLPNGVRLRVDSHVNEKALRRVLQVMKGTA
jgi:transposase